MASIRNLKKNLNDVLGEIIEHVLAWQKNNPNANKKDSEAIVDEAILVFDDLISRINAKNIPRPKAHFKAILDVMEEKAEALVNKLNAL